MPEMICPGDAANAPSDAIVLFDWRCLSKWESEVTEDKDKSKKIEPEWKVKNGYLEVGRNRLVILICKTKKGWQLLKLPAF